MVIIVNETGLKLFTYNKRMAFRKRFRIS